MDKSLNVASYNCRGFPKTISKLGTKPTIDMLLKDIKIDIICLQETFLSKQDLSCLNVIHRDFQGVGRRGIQYRHKRQAYYRSPLWGSCYIVSNKMLKMCNPNPFQS